MPTQSGRSLDRPLFLRFRGLWCDAVLAATPQIGIMEQNTVHSPGLRDGD